MTRQHAGSEELKHFLKHHPDCAFIEMMVPDMSGQMRGKRLAPKAAAKLFGDGGGVRLPGSNYLLDATGRNVDALPYGGADGDPDFFCHAAPGTLKPLPWSGEQAGQVLCSMSDAEGRPHFADPRHLLARQEARLARMGLRAVVAFEMEFHLVDAEAFRARGEVLPARLPLSGRRPVMTNVYGLDDVGEFSALFSALARAAEEMGLEAETVVSEYGPGQYEVNLKHVTGALQAADRAALLKRAIREVALRHGVIATFMAKPFAERAGNGMHLHISLIDSQGDNAFAGDKPLADTGRRAAPLLGRAVAGLLETMAEAMAIFAPNANSYRRLRPGTYAPVTASWGGDDRTVPIRIPPGGREEMRIEHRVAGADASPHLVAAAVLAGMIHGMEEKLLPPPPAAPGGGEAGRPLPLFWPQALEAFAGARVLRRAMGEQWAEGFLAARRQELEAHHFTIPPLDHEWHLHTA